MPNAYTEFVVKLATKRGLTKTGLADKAGLSKQVVGSMWNDDRDLLKARPEPKTIAGLASALGIPEVALWQKVVEALGIPLANEATLVVELETASNADILRVLARRLEGGGEHGDSSAPTSTDDPDEGGTGGLRLVDTPPGSDAPEASEPDETVAPAALDPIDGVDEEPGGSEHEDG